MLCGKVSISLDHAFTAWIGPAKPEILAMRMQAHDALQAGILFDDAHLMAHRLQRLDLRGRRVGALAARRDGLADMADAVLHNREPYVNGEAGLRALELVLAIYQSAATGLPVSLPLGDVSTLDFSGRFDHR